MPKQFKYILLLVILLFIGGSLGYFLIEEWSFLDSLYMTVITLSTTGFKEVYPLSPAGRILTMLLIILGISILFYALREINIVLFEGKFFRERKMQKRISRVENHYIICGFGRMGKKIAQELDKRNKKFVIIEKEQDLLDQQEYYFLNGDATEDKILLSAGIEKAVGLVAVLSSDIANTFTVLTARGINPTLKIIARAEEENSKDKLISAGADRVILPYEIGGFRISQALLKPTVMDYIDEVFSRSELGLEIEEVKISEKSKLISSTIAESAIRSRFNTIIVAIYRASGGLIYNPKSETELQAGDNLIVIGERTELAKLQGIANV